MELVELMIAPLHERDPFLYTFLSSCKVWLNINNSVDLQSKEAIAKHGVTLEALQRSR